MPKVVGTTPYGTAVEHDDGNVYFLPEDLVVPPERTLEQFPSLTEPQPAATGVVGTGQTREPLDILGGPRASARVHDQTHGGAQALGIPPAGFVAPPNDLDLIEIENSPPLDPLPPALSLTQAPPATAAPVAPPAPAPAPTAAPVTPAPGVVDGPVTTPEPGAAPASPAAAPPPEELSPAEQAARAVEAAGEEAAYQATARAEDLDDANAAAARLRAKREADHKDTEAEIAAAKIQRENAIWELTDFEQRNPPRETPVWLRAVSIALGGIGMAMAGRPGENPVLAVLDQMAKQEAARRAGLWERSKGKAAVAGDRLVELSRTQDEYAKAQEISIKESQARAAEAQALRASTPQLRAHAQATAAQIRQSAMKDAVELQEKIATGIRADREQDRKDLETKEDIAHKKRSDSTAAYAARTGRLSQEAGEKQYAQTREDALTQRAFDNADKLARLTKDLNTANVSGDKAKADLLKTQLETAKLEVERSPSMVRKVIDPTSGKKSFINYTQADGTPWLVPNGEDRAAIEDKWAQVEQFVNIVDTLRDLRDKNGPEWFKTAAARRMGVEYANLITSWKDDKELGALSGADLGLAQGGVGTDDPNEFRDIGPGLEQARARAISGMRTKMKSKGYTGQAYDVDDLTSSGLKRKVVNNEAEDALAKAERQRSINERVDRRLKEVPLAGPALEAARKYQANFVAGSHARYKPVDYSPLVTLANGAGDSASSARSALALQARKDPGAVRAAVKARVDLASDMNEGEWDALVQQHAPDLLPGGLLPLPASPGAPK